MSALTVGLPVHNAMPFLPETVDSLLRQDFQNFNVLIIDDGSADGSSEYLSTIKDPRVRIIRQENRGLTSTLNRMLREAETPWLVRQDADDIAYPNRIKLIKEYTDRYPSAGMFYSLANYYQENTSFGKFRTTVASPKVLSNLTRAGYLISICHPTAVLNVEKTLALGGYRFDLYVEDIDLWWRMALSHDIILIPEITVGYRHNLSSICGNNLEASYVNTLYIQYLLLSYLWGLNQRPYERVKPELARMTSKNRLRFKEHIRKVNICAGRKQYAKAMGHSIIAFLSDPKYFLNRLAYEFGGKELAVSGTDPRVFASLSDALWKNGGKRDGGQ